MVVAASTPSSWLKFGPSAVAPTRPVAQLVPRVPAHTPRHSSGLQFKVLPSTHHTLPSPAFLAAASPSGSHSAATNRPLGVPAWPGRGRSAGNRCSDTIPAAPLHLLHPRGAAGSSFNSPQPFRTQIITTGKSVQQVQGHRKQFKSQPNTACSWPCGLCPCS